VINLEDPEGLLEKKSTSSRSEVWTKNDFDECCLAL
jgi:hypothetical protein